MVTWIKHYLLQFPQPYPNNIPAPCSTPWVRFGRMTSLSVLSHCSTLRGSAVPPSQITSDICDVRLIIKIINDGEAKSKIKEQWPGLELASAQNLKQSVSPRINMARGECAKSYPLKNDKNSWSIRVYHLTLSWFQVKNKRQCCMKNENGPLSRWHLNLYIQ